jgi:4-amino-4-deoxy-L-arabinose transferase-like glycosyltransferase
MQQMDINYEINACEPRRNQMFQVLFLLIISAAVFVSGIGKMPLGDPDEGRYATISKNMIDRGNYLEPWLGDHYYPDKPPFYFWLTAGAFKLLGTENAQFSARIVPVLGGILTILATYLIASTLFNHLIGLISGGVLLSSVLMIGFGKFVRMDIYLVAFLSLAFWAFLKGYKEQGPTRWFLLMYPFLALAFLTKGPIALGIPGVVILIFLIWQAWIRQGDWRVLNHMRIILGLALMILIAGPWFFYMADIHPDYFQQFFGKHNFGRGLSSESGLGHRNSPLLYLVTLLVGFLPWTPLMVLAVLRYTKSVLTRGSTDWESRFLFIWFVFVMAAFGVMKTRLFYYIFPAFIPAAIFLGRFLYDYWQSDFPRRRRQLTFAWAYPLAFVVGMTIVFLYIAAAFGGIWLKFHEHWVGPQGFEDQTWWGCWGWLVCLIYRLGIAVGLVKLFWYLWRNWQLPQFAGALMTATLILAVDLSYTELPRVADLRSCQRLVPLVKGNYEAGTVIMAGPYSHNEQWSLPFYLGPDNPVKMVYNFGSVTDYYKNPGKIIYLSDDDDPYNQVQMVLKNRMEVLAQYRSIHLMLIKPKEIVPQPTTQPGRLGF